MKMLIRAGSIDESEDLFESYGLDFSDINSSIFLKSKLFFNKKEEIKIEGYKNYYRIILTTNKKDKWNRKIPILALIKIEASENIKELADEIVNKISDFSKKIDYPIPKENIVELGYNLKNIKKNNKFNFNIFILFLLAFAFFVFMFVFFYNNH